jgi:peptidoglycan/xylan/chitin deacetylase (PgdA/CDA1 family)
MGKTLAPRTEDAPVACHNRRGEERPARVTGPAAGILRALASRRSAILCYHGVARTSIDEDPGSLCVAPERFRGQIELLRAAGYQFVTVAELARRAGGSEPPPGLVALSFDDGMDNNHHVLLPILREHGIPATVYVTTGLIGRPNPWMAPESGARMMTVDELRDLARAGVELGAHTVTHPDLSTLAEHDCLREMVESREAIERLVGVEVSTFAYPFFKLSPAAIAAARRAGFEAAVTGDARGSWAPFELKRSMITGKDGRPSFVLKVADAYDPLFYSAPGRVVRATTRSARRRRRRTWERVAGRG